MDVVMQRWKAAWTHALITGALISIQAILGFVLLSVPTGIIVNIHLLIGLSILITASLTLFRLQDLKKAY